MNISKRLIVYYLLLLSLFCTWTNPLILPAMPLRLAFLFAVMAPVLTKRNDVFPIVIVLFFGVASAGVSYSYMPTSTVFYLILTCISFLLYSINSQRISTPPLFIFLLLILSFLSNSQSDSVSQSMYFPILMIIMMWTYCDNLVEDKKSLLSYSFVLVSLVLSYQYYKEGSLYTSEYGHTGMDRVGWVDPNYWGFTLAMGLLAAAQELYTRFCVMKLLEKLILITSILIVFPVIILNASRGAMLGVSCFSCVLIFTGKIKNIYKVLIIVFLAIFIVLLYRNNYFDLLIYRVEYDDEMTGSGRTVIWADYINAFLENGNPQKWLFGYGNYEGQRLAYGRIRALHNDFLAFLVEYGFLGFILFLCLFFYPIKLVGFRNNLAISFTLFLGVACMTLEPFTHGSFMYFAFWYYLVIVAKHEKKAKFSINLS